MSDYGFKIALPGYDIKTATPEQCAVHSGYPPFKSKTNQTPPHFATVVIDFTATITQNLTQNLYSISHGYTYIPFTIASISFSDGLGTTAVGIGSTGIGANLSINAYSTTSNFIISIYDNFNWTSNSASMTVNYYIFAESGT